MRVLFSFSSRDSRDSHDSSSRSKRDDRRRYFRIHTRPSIAFSLEFLTMTTDAKHKTLAQQSSESDYSARKSERTTTVKIRSFWNPLTRKAVKEESLFRNPSSSPFSTFDRGALQALSLFSRPIYLLNNSICAVIIYGALKYTFQSRSLERVLPLSLSCFLSREHAAVFTINLAAGGELEAERRRAAATRGTRRGWQW